MSVFRCPFPPALWKGFVLWTLCSLALQSSAYDRCPGPKGAAPTLSSERENALRQCLLLQHHFTLGSPRMLSESVHTEAPHSEDQVQWSKTGPEYWQFFFFKHNFPAIFNVQPELRNPDLRTTAAGYLGVDPTGEWVPAFKNSHYPCWENNKKGIFVKAWHLGRQHKMFQHFGYSIGNSSLLLWREGISWKQQLWWWTKNGLDITDLTRQQHTLCRSHLCTISWELGNSIS